MAAESLITIKTSKEALRLLRLAAAATGELQHQVMLRLLQEEVAQLKKAKKI